MITKAIIPVAGFGTRFLPASKVIPKEMFPIVNKPVIQYIVEEAVDSGITDIIFVTSCNKKTLEDHFDDNFALEYKLEQKKKIKELEAVRRVSRMANFYYVRQPIPQKGDGDAIIRGARFLSAGESAAVMFGDDVFINQNGEPVLKQMIRAFEKYKAPMFAVHEITGKAIERYGVIDGEEIDNAVYKVNHVVEKPKQEEAPSHLAISGRYIITPELVHALKGQDPAEDGEIRTSHAFRDTMEKGDVLAYKFIGTWHDCGDMLGWMQANAALGLQDEMIKDEYREYLKNQTDEA